MPRLYTSFFEPTAVTTAIDFFELLASANNVIKVWEWGLFQTTELGDAAEEVLDIETVRGDGTVTSGSGGAASTPQPIDNGDSAAVSTVETLNTTRMVVGTGVLDILEKPGWNIRIPLEKIYIPERRPVISPSDRWTLSLNTAPADSVTIGGYVVFEEIGG